MHTFDVFSDITFGFTLYFAGHPIYALSMLLPVAVANIFLISQWWHIENSWKKKVCTLPLLFLLCWPQYHVIKILQLGWNRSEKWKNAILYYERNICSIGRYSLVLVTQNRL